MQLWMYATPVVYPLSQVPDFLRSIILINPVTSAMELYRYALFGVGTIQFTSILISLGIMGIVALLGIVIFNRVERTFMDTV